MKMFGSQKVLVFGDVMLDSYIDGDVKRISPEAPVPVLSVTSTDQRLGGAGNVVNNINALDAQVRMLSYWGTDPAGDAVSKLLEGMNVDTAFARRYGDISTMQKTRLVSRHHQLIRYDTEKIEPARKEYVDLLSENLDAIFDGISAAVISDYGKGIVTGQTAQLVIAEANKRRIPVLVDPKSQDYQKYSGATVCKPNMNEFAEAFANAGPCSEADILPLGILVAEKYKFDYLLITRSEKGLSLIHDREKCDFPAEAREVVDVTGAGDTVAAVIALCLGAGLPIDQCCRMANKAAAIVVSKFGAATVSSDELKHQDKYASSGASLSKALRKQGKKIVFTNGCFDLVHAGHIKLFEQAKSFGDVLIIGMNSDRSVQAIKGPSRPVVSQDNRARLLCALSSVDYVVMFDEETPERLVSEIIPDVLVKGGDWRGKTVVGRDLVESNGGRVELIDLEQGLSTTEIIKKIILQHE